MAAFSMKIRIHPKRPKKLGRAVKRFKPRMRKAAIESGELILKGAQSKVPVLTGALKRSLEYVVKPFKKGWKFFVGSGVKTGVHIAWALIQDIGGRAGIGGSVRIKGTQYLTGTFKRLRKKLKQIARKHTRKLFR